MISRSRTLFLGSALVLGALYWMAVYAPLVERLEVAERERVLVANRMQEATTLERLHDQLKPLLDRSSGINLVTQLDALMRARQLKDRVVQMQSQPVKKPADGSLEPNESALLRLDRLDLNQLHAALEAMGSLHRNVWVRTLEIRRQGGEEAMLVLEVDELEL